VRCCAVGASGINWLPGAAMVVIGLTIGVGLLRGQRAGTR